MSDQPVNANIIILGKNYPIRCLESEISALQKAADYLNSKMTEIQDSGKVINLERIAIISALNIANQLLQQEQQKSSLIARINQQIAKLQEKLDHAVNKTRQTELHYVADSNE